MKPFSCALEEIKSQEYSVDPSGPSVCIMVHVPYTFDKSEWLGVAVCLMLKSMARSFESDNIYWSFKAFEDKSCSIPERKFECGKLYCDPHLYVPFFPIDTLSRHHLGVHHCQLVLKLRFESQFWEIKECGWRLICKEDFDAWNASTSASSSSLQIANLESYKPPCHEFVVEDPISVSFDAQAQPPPAQRRYFEFEVCYRIPVILL